MREKQPRERESGLFQRFRFLSLFPRVCVWRDAFAPWGEQAALVRACVHGDQRATLIYADVHAHTTGCTLKRK